MMSVGQPDDGSLEPPAWEIPGWVLAERIVARSNDIVISVGPIHVYSTGALITFAARFRPGLEHSAENLQDELYGLLKQRAEPGAAGLRLEVRYGDGLVRMNVDSPGEDAEVRRGPRLDLLSGGSRGSVWTLTYWVWPPPATEMTILATWPAVGVSAGQAVVSSSVLRSAADSIQRLS